MPGSGRRTVRRGFAAAKPSVTAKQPSSLIEPTAKPHDLFSTAVYSKADAAIYGVPRQHDRVLYIRTARPQTDPAGDVISQLGKLPRPKFSLPGVGKYDCAVVGRDGCIYAPRGNSEQVLMIVPSAGAKPLHANRQMCAEPLFYSLTMTQS